MQANELQSGDILLYHSDSLISKAIRLLDGTEVNHAGLFMGDVVAESLGGRGLCTNSLAESVAGSQWVQIRRLSEPPGTMDPVLEVARAYLQQHNRYGYEQIVLLAGICLTRKLDLDSVVLRRLVRAAMRKATQWLELLHSDGKEPMICSEFVFRAYDEASSDPGDPYTLTILSQEGQASTKFSSFWSEKSGTDLQAAPARAHADSLWAQLASRTTVKASGTVSEKDGEPEDLDALIEQYVADVEQTGKASATAPAVQADVTTDELLGEALRFATTACHAAQSGEAALQSEAPQSSRSVEQVLADFVTPGDLLKCPSLVTLGLLDF